MAGGKGTEIKLGVLMGFTGPIESLTPAMADAAEFAMAEVSRSGALLDGATVTPLRVDTTCLDPGAAIAAASALVAGHEVSGIVGASCSGVSQAILTGVAVPEEIVMVSPSASSAALSTVPDDGFFFRTTASEPREGVLMAADLRAQGVQEIAIAFGNDSFSRAIADGLRDAFEAAGGTVTLGLGYEVGKTDYGPEIAALASAGDARLVIVGSDDTTGSALAQAALDGGFFDAIYLSGLLMSPGLAGKLGPLADAVSGLVPDSRPPGFETVAGGQIDASAIFAAESYDAAALVMLAMQAAGSSDPAIYKDFMTDVANGSGVRIGAGELALGLDILKAGGRIDYQGATAVDLTPDGDALGTFRSASFSDGTLVIGAPVLGLPGPGEDRITGTDAAETFRTGAGDDLVDAGGGRDRIAGGGGSDTLRGGAGRDIIKGGRGEDRLDGGQGGDRIAGGSSDDVLSGGGGSDRFVFAGRDGFDIITDWQARDMFQIKGASGHDDLAFDASEAGVIVSWAETSVLVLGTDAGDLGRDDFLFL